MKNWITTLCGVVGAVALALKGQFPEYAALLDGVSALAVGLLGFFAKQFNVTGTGS